MLTAPQGEWWLLSLTELIIMPGFSGYSRTSFAYSQRPNAICVRNFEGKFKYGCKSYQTQNDLMELGAGFR